MTRTERIAFAIEVAHCLAANGPASRQATVAIDAEPDRGPIVRYAFHENKRRFLAGRVLTDADFARTPANVADELMRAAESIAWPVEEMQ